MVAAGLGYRPGLDGARGLAIVLVLLGHGGFVRPQVANVGVTLFFVLSGFLITRLLIEERRATGSVSLRAFYLRRARRLFPALLVMAPIVAVIAGDLRGGLWALSYIGNWAQASGADLGAFGHTWSLAIEEQFYLLWPVAFLAIRPSRMILLLVVVAAACLCTRFGVPMSDAVMSYSTVTQAPSLFAGVLLAFVCWQRVPWAALWLLVGLLLLAVSAWASHAWMDPIGALGALFVVTAAYQGHLAWRPLMLLGTISYGVYLWQTPVLLLTGAEFGAQGMWHSAFAVTATVLIAGVSFVLVERPFIRHRWQAQLTAGRVSS